MIDFYIFLFHLPVRLLQNVVPDATLLQRIVQQTERPADTPPRIQTPHSQPQQGETTAAG